MALFMRLAMVEVNHKRGYINKSGQIIVSPRFDFAMPFSEGLALVSQSGKVHFINRLGKMITDIDIGPGAESFSEGMAKVQVGKKWGFIDSAGELAIAPEFDYAFSFSDGLAAVGKDQHYWFINRTGATVAGPWISTSLGCDGWKFGDGVALVQADGRCVLIDESGSVLVQTDLHPLDGVIYPFSEGLARIATDSGFGYIDENGLIAIEPQFDYATDFSLPGSSRPELRP